MQRYFIDQSVNVGQQIKLPADVVKHWIQVLRGTAGDQAELVDRQERLYLAELAADETVTILSECTAEVELPIHVVIFSGLPKQDKAEWIVQKATELGAYAINFFSGDWSVAKWQPNKVEKKVARLQKIANGAAEQSHRTHIPTVNFVGSLKQGLADLRFDHLVVAYEEAAKSGEKAQLMQVLQQTHPGETFVAVFGPEGGISPAEIDLLKTEDAIIAGLGPRILRTETAPLYLLSAVSTVLELSKTQK